MKELSDIQLKKLRDKTEQKLKKLQDYLEYIEREIESREGKSQFIQIKEEVIAKEIKEGVTAKAEFFRYVIKEIEENDLVGYYVCYGISNRISHELFCELKNIEGQIFEYEGQLYQIRIEKSSKDENITTVGLRKHDS